MAIRCPRCGREFDVTLFQYGRTVQCLCGETVSAGEGHTIRAEGGGRSGSEEAGGGTHGTEGGEVDWEALEKEIFGAARLREEDRAVSERIRTEADRIVQAIAGSDVPRVDIEIEIRNFRRRVLAQFPEKAQLFEALYMGRFRHLWSRFRADEGPLGD